MRNYLLRLFATIASVGSVFAALPAGASALERLFVSKPEPLAFFAQPSAASNNVASNKGSPTAEPVNHASWQTWLDRFIVTNHPSGIHRVRYAAVDSSGKALLNSYLLALQAVDPRQLSRNEQLAYWINLYNAATVQVIVNHPGVKSIREIKSGIFSVGPWKMPLLKVAGQTLSLDDIEHRIVRPLFRDRRVHFALNCASLGCPDLAAQAYQGATLEAMLNAQQLAYLSHARAIHFSKGELVLSSLFQWYREDFAADEAGAIAYLAAHAPAAVAARLRGYHGAVSYAYDWDLNAAP